MKLKIQKIFMRTIALAWVLTGLGSFVWGEETPSPSKDSLTELSLEELMNVEIVTYSKSPQKWFDTRPRYSSSPKKTSAAPG